MTKILYLILLFNFSTIFSQNNVDIFTDFESDFKKLDGILIFDDLELELSNSKLIQYSIIKKLIINEKKEPYIEIGNINNHKFYNLGYVNISDNEKGYLIYHLSKDFNGSRFLYCAIFQNDLFKTLLNIGQRVKGLESNNVNSVIIPNEYLIKSYETNNGFEYESFRLGETMKSFEENYIGDQEELISEEYFKKIKEQTYFSLQRKSKKYLFDKTFFLTKFNFIPLKIVTGLNNSKSLHSIKGNREISFNSYYIDSYNLSNNETLILILNEYNYRDYNYIADVSYLLIDNEKKLKSSGRMANIYIDSNNKIVTLNQAEVLLERKRLLLKKEGRTYFYKLADNVTN